jgi:hypothetical protein
MNQNTAMPCSSPRGLSCSNADFLFGSLNARVCHLPYVICYLPYVICYLMPQSCSSGLNFCLIFAP